MNESNAPSVGANSDAESGAIVRYLTRCASQRLLVHGVTLQIVSVVCSFASSSVTKVDPEENLRPWERVLSLSWGLSFASNTLNLIGWAMVIYACGKVIAEALKERGA
jgi:hypothetical protein